MRKSMYIALVLAMLIGLGVNAKAQAATITLRTCDINEFVWAVFQANRISAPVEIVLRSGCTYTATQNAEPSVGVNPYASFGSSALPYIRGILIIDGNGATLTRASWAPAMRFFTVSGSSVLGMKDLTIKNGVASANIYTEGSNGGAISIHSSSTLLINDIRFENNYAGLQGGAIYQSFGTITSEGRIKIENSTFRNNIANQGGAIHTSMHLDVDRTQFLGNRANMGGGVNILPSPQLSLYLNFQINGSCFVDNRNGDISTINSTAVSVNAMNNWWGDRGGPEVTSRVNASSPSSYDRLRCGGTRPDPSPRISRTVPRLGASNIVTGTNVSITFSESVRVTRRGVRFACSTGGGVRGRLSISGNTYTINPRKRLPNNANCILSIPTRNVTDMGGNTLVDSDGNRDGVYHLRFNTRKSLRSASLELESPLTPQSNVSEATSPPVEVELGVLEIVEPGE